MPTVEQTLREIQREYFLLLRDCVPPEWRDPIAAGSGVLDVYRSIVGRIPSDIAVPGYGGMWVPATVATIDTLVREVSDFWEAMFERMHAALRDLDALGLLARMHGGDRPVDAFGRFGLYFDTLCIPDPIYCPLRFRESWEKKSSLEARWGLALEGILSLLQVAPLALGDCSPPVCIVYPKALMVPGGPSEQPVSEKANDLCDELYKEIFELPEDCGSFADVVDAVRTMSDARLRDLQERTPFLEKLASIPPELEVPLDWHLPTPLRAAKRRAASEARSTSEKILWQSYMPVTNCLFDEIGSDYECGQLGLEHFIGGSFNWEVHKWKTKYDATRAAHLAAFSEEDVIVRAFGMDSLKWLSNVPQDALVRLRSEGYMAEMRELFRISRRDVKQASLGNFDSVVRRIEGRLEDAMRAHAEELEGRKKELKKRFGLALAGAVATTGLAIASVSFPPLSALAAGTGVATAILGGPGAVDAINEFLKGRRRIDAVRARPLSILAEAHAGHN